MKVPLIDLRGQHLSLRPQLIKAVESVIDSQQFVLGSEVEAFENKVAEYCSTEFAVGCASGSDALLLALMALLRRLHFLRRLPPSLESEPGPSL